MKIVLLGYMGSGKSTVGKILSRESGYPFLDLDAYIEEKEGMPIRELFRTKGGIYFRKKETEYLEEVLSAPGDLILSTGGGAPCYGNNLEIMLAATPAVWYLRVPIPELAARLAKEKEYRPLIKHLEDAELPEFIGKHLFERRAFYERAHHTLSVGDQAPDDIAREILEVSLSE